MSNSEDKKYPFWHVAPHIVILGAGASKAAFPDGDKNGKQLPLMNNFVKVLGLRKSLKKHGINYEKKNFEKIYDNLHNSHNYPKLLEHIEDRIRDYFLN